MSHWLCGIVRNGDKPREEPHLPLEQLVVHADIIGVSAIVTVTQVFSTWIWKPILFSRYVFPVPVNAAVCGFEMETSHRGPVVAISKEFHEAVGEFLHASEDCHVLGLVEQRSDNGANVLSISLGSLPPCHTITTKLKYVADLSNGGSSNQIQLLLPLCFGKQYGGSVRSPPLQRISIFVNIRTKGIIQDISSPSHPNLVIKASQVESTREQSPAYTSHQQVVEYHSPYYLERDFVLNVTATGLSEPLCIAERHPSGSIALGLTMVPKLDLPIIPSQEYLFVIDRGAIMFGDKILTARNALKLLLHALPAEGTIFNIIGFGRQSDWLWPESKAYDQHTLATACAYVDNTAAEYCGTDIPAAIAAAVTVRQYTIPTVCFMLTDGETSKDPHETLSAVSRHVAHSPPNAPLRIFTLDIGKSFSAPICEAVARVGNGACLKVAAADDMATMCAKLIQASRTLPMKRISTSWNAYPPWAKLFTRHVVDRVQEGEKQAMLNGTRFTHYALVQKHGYEIPKHVVVSVRTTGKVKPVSIRVPVQELPYVEDNSALHLTHILAARSILQRLEDSKETSTRIIDLATKYSLVTWHASFVVVDHGDFRTVERGALHSHAPPPHELTRGTLSDRLLESSRTMMQITIGSIRSAAKSLAHHTPSAVRM